MAVIGTFTRAKNGGWEGSIRTFTTTLKVRFVPNDDRASDAAPHFHIVTAQCELGAAWVRRTGSDNQEFLSVQLDDPTIERPISAALFYSECSQRAQLVWNRRQKGETHDR
jgi:uncharacterized protein (DUF736 family)